MTEDYKAQYEELKAVLNIHQSHEHEDVLRYARIAVIRYGVAERVIAEARDHVNKLQELDKLTW